jgi:simple sugar transport system permease protein
VTAVVPETPESPESRTPEAVRSSRRFSLPVRYMATAAAAMLLLSITRAVTDQGPMTAPGTFSSAIELAMPIALAGLGGLWAERAGVVNIGLEGMMILGTWFGAWGGIEYGPWWGVALGALGGAVGGLLHAVATVSFGVDHVISGVAINILGAGVARFLTGVAYEGGQTQSPQVPGRIPSFDVPVLGDALTDLADKQWFLISDVASLLTAVTHDVSWLVILGLALFPLTFLVLWRTPVGLRMRSVGEDPYAAETLGVNVYRMKYLAVTVSGALAGLAGATLVYVFARQFQDGQTNGRGFIGLAAVVFGNWRPGGLLAGALLFGFTDALQSQQDAVAHGLLLFVALIIAALGVRSLVKGRLKPGMAALVMGALVWLVWVGTERIPNQLIPVTPHITTLLVLVFASQRLRMPAADGLPYRKGGGR